MVRILEYTKAHFLPALHQQLIDAGYTPWPVVGEDPARPFHLELGFPDDFADDAGVEAVVMAHDRAAALAAYEAARQAEADDNSQVRQAIPVLVADADRLEDTAQALTAQQVRNHLARTDRVLARALRVLARRLGE